MLGDLDVRSVPPFQCTTILASAGQIFAFSPVHPIPEQRHSGAGSEAVTWKAGDVATRLRQAAGQERSAQIAPLANALARESDAAAAKALDCAPPSPPSTPTPAIELHVTESEAREAGGAESSAFNAMVLNEAAHAYVWPGDAPETLVAKAKSAIAIMRDAQPRNPREALMIRRMIECDAMFMESRELARKANGNPLLRNAYISQAVSLSAAATALSEALERMRGSKGDAVQVPKIVVERVERVVAVAASETPRRLEGA
jgi:hypothetical protein